jgi:hypothetical protein
MRPGDRFPRALDVSEDLGTPALIFASRPDWVTAPPELGGGRLDILAEGSRGCPKCETSVSFYALERSLGVFNCGPCGQFFWVSTGEGPRP